MLPETEPTVSWGHKDKGGVKLEENLALLGSRDSLQDTTMTLAEAMASGLLDSNSGLFIDPATGEEMSVAEALSKNRIDASNAMIITPHGVMSLQDAIDQGLVDLERGLCKDPDSGLWISLDEAVKKGLLQPSTGEAEPQSLDELLKKGFYDPKTGMVTDSYVGRKIPLLQAIEEGLVDKKSVLVEDSLTGRLMSLTEASERGVIDSDNIVDAVRKGLHNSSDLTSEPHSSDDTVSKNKQYESISIVKAIVQGFYDPSTNVVQDPQSGFVLTIQQALEEGLITTRDVFVRDDSSGHEVTFRTAMDNDIIDLEAGTLIFDSGKIMKLDSAVANGSVYEKPVPHIPMPVVKAITDGYFIEETGVFIDPRSEDNVNLNDALARKLLNPFSVVVNNPQSCEVMSLEEAIDADMINSDTCMVHDSGSNQDLTLPQAIRSDIVIPRPMSITTAVGIGLYNEAIGKFLDPTCRKFFTLSEAINVGLLDDGSMIIDPATGREMTLAMAVACGVVDADNGNVSNANTSEVVALKDAVGAKGIVGVVGSDEGMSLQEAIEKGVYDTDRGIVIDPNTGEPMSLAEALARGLIDPNSFVLDPVTKEKITLSNAVRNGVIDVNKGKIINQDSGEAVPLDAKAVGRNVTLEDLQRDGLFDPRTNTVIDPLSGDSMSLKEALENGIIDPQTALIDPSSGKAMTFEEALRAGVLDLNTGQLENEKSGQKVSLGQFLKGSDIETAPVEYSLEQVLSLGMFDPETNSITNPLTGETMSLQEAIEGGLIDLTATVKDPQTGATMTLSDAIESGIFDPNLGIFINTLLGTEISLADALDEELIVRSSDDLKVSIDTFALNQNSTDDQIQDGSVRYLDDEKDELSSDEGETPNSRQMFNADDVTLAQVKVPDPFTGSILDIEEASRRRLFDPKSATLVNTETGEMVDLQEAIDTGLAVIGESSDETADSNGHDASEKNVKDATLIKRFDALGDLSELCENEDMDGNNEADADAGAVRRTPMSLNDIFENGLYNEDTGEITDADTGKKFTFQQAIDEGILDPESIRLKDPDTGGLLGYDEAIARGIINPLTGDVKGIDGEELTLKEAVRGGAALLSQDVDALSLEKAIEQGICNPDTGLVTDPRTGELISLQEAIERGIIDPANSRIRDPHTGEELTLEDAAQKGMINLAVGEVKDPFTGKNLTLGQALLTNLLVPAKVKPCSLGEAADSKLFVEELGRLKEPESGAYKTVGEGIELGLVDPTKTLFKDTKSGRLISLDEAIGGGLFNDEEGKIVDPSSGHLIGVTEAMERGVIVDIARPALLTVPEAVDLGLIDAHDNKIHHPFTGQKFCIADAVDMNVLSDKDTFVLNTTSGEYVPLSKALDDNLINGTTGRVHDKKQGRLLGLVPATADKLVIDINALQGFDNRSQVTGTLDGMELDDDGRHGKSGQLVIPAEQPRLTTSDREGAVQLSEPLQSQVIIHFFILWVVTKINHAVVIIFFELLFDIIKFRLRGLVC